MPAEEGFPSYLPSRLAEFYERTGVVEVGIGRWQKRIGSICAIGAVSLLEATSLNLLRSILNALQGFFGL